METNETIACAKELITEVHARFTKGGRTVWCNNSLARDTLGRSVSHNASEATQFCMLGMLLKVHADSKVNKPDCLSTASIILGRVCRSEFGESSEPVEVNDVRGFDAVMQVLNAAVQS